jgi:carbon storage regulator
MLVLTRKTDQRIQIGEDISIVILRVQSRRVKIGIEAPRGMCIIRSELLPPAARGQEQQPRETTG